MTVEGIDIDIKEVAATGSQLALLSESLKNTMEALENEMKGTENVWKSVAQELLKQDYQGFDRKKEEIYRDLKQYAQFLQDTAAEYGYTENIIDKNANCFN